MANKNEAHVNFWIPEELMLRLKVLCVKKRKSIKQVATEAIEQYLEIQEAPIQSTPQSFQFKETPVKSTEVYQPSFSFSETNKATRVDRKPKYDAEFEEFWNLYDKRVDKSVCQREWSRLTKRDKQLIMQHVPKYKATITDMKYQRNPLTYLRRKNWLDAQ